MITPALTRERCSLEGRCGRGETINNRGYMSDERNPFGEVIFAYTRTEAIADGVLIDVSTTAKEAGFRYPVALTHAVFSDYVRVPEGVTDQDEAGRLWDILHMFRVAAAQSSGESEILFKLYVKNNNRSAELVTLKSVCGPDDDAMPCITVMLPQED